MDIKSKDLELKEVYWMKANVVKDNDGKFISVDKVVDIIFKTHKHFYQFIGYKKESRWIPLSIIHFKVSRKDNCYFCGERVENPYCDVLQDNIDDVFSEIQKIPAIR